MPLHPQLRQQWVTAGYTSTMGSSEVVPPPSPEKIRVYYFTQAEFAISALALKRLKVSRFSDLNDPFEMLALNAKRRDVLHALTRNKADLDAERGMICFSANWTAPILWSHYASKHSGICLGFDLQRHRATNVEYVETRLPVPIGPDGSVTNFGDQLKHRLLCTKSSDWESEEEIRLLLDIVEIEEEGKLRFYKFNADLSLKEVILGPSCHIDLPALRSFSSQIHPEVLVYKAKLANKHFAVVPDPESLPHGYN